MRWKSERRSSNVEDKRGASSNYAANGGGGLVLLFRIVPLLLRTKGGRVILLVGAVVVFGGQFFGIDVLSLLSGQGGAVPAQSARYEPTAEDKELADFVSVVLADTETTWHKQFQTMGATYQEPKLVLFSGAVNSACGLGRAAMGPFYCPGDHKVYIDLSFYRDLKQRHNAPGDFAQSYVIAHEVGHHVQNLLGISGKVESMKGQAGEAKANALSVRLELQADCFAGIWAHAANVDRKLVEAGDIDEALNAASAIGDDRLQKQAQGYVVPESFTHGTSEQRRKWFNAGYTAGAMKACDTFSAKPL